MAKIQVDFDQVMHFADLHRDLAASLDAHRSVFNLDGNRLDQIINEFSLSRSTSNPHFSGQTVAWSLLDASDRAQRVAHSMMETSTRIFQQANPIVDDHFDWGHSLYNALNGANLTAPKNALLEFVGGKLVDVIVVAGRYGVLATPAFIIVAPVFLLVTGGLTLYEGVQQVLDVASAAWDRVSGGLKILAGGATIVVGGVVGAMLITAGTATAAATAILLAPVLIAAAVIGVVALAIDHRNELGSLLGFGPTLAETNNDQLANVPKTWTIPLGPSTGPTIIADFGPATSPGLSVGTAAGRTVLQGSGPIRLQGPTPQPAGSGTASPAVATRPLNQLPHSTRDWAAAQAAYDQGVPGYVQAGQMQWSTLPGKEDEYQCVSWAWFRMRELGYTGALIRGNGGEMSAKLGGAESTQPKLGAVVSSAGHVFIVEEVQRDGAGQVIRARYSEMNSMTHATTGTPAPDEDSAGNFIRASADEFRCDQWIERKADGTFQREGNTETLTIFNPDYSEKYG